MTKNHINEEKHKSEALERSDEEILEEKSKNQHSIDIFIESGKNWC